MINEILEKALSIPVGFWEYCLNDSPESSFWTVSVSILMLLQFFGFAWLNAYITDYLFVNKHKIRFLEKLLIVPEIALIAILFPYMYLGWIVVTILFVLMFWVITAEVDTKGKVTNIYNYKENQKWAKTHILYRFLARNHLIPGNRTKQDVNDLNWRISMRIKNSRVIQKLRHENTV